MGRTVINETENKQTVILNDSPEGVSGGYFDSAMVWHEFGGGETSIYPLTLVPEVTPMCGFGAIQWTNPNSTAGSYIEQLSSSNRKRRIHAVNSCSAFYPITNGKTYRLRCSAPYAAMDVVSDEGYILVEKQQALTENLRATSGWIELHDGYVDFDTSTIGTGTRASWSLKKNAAGDADFNDGEITSITIEEL